MSKREGFGEAALFFMDGAVYFSIITGGLVLAAWALISLV